MKELSIQVFCSALLPYPTSSPPDGPKSGTVKQSREKKRKQCCRVSGNFRGGFSTKIHCQNNLHIKIKKNEYISHVKGSSNDYEDNRSNRRAALHGGNPRVNHSHHRTASSLIISASQSLGPNSKYSWTFDRARSCN